jgi:hypothetical protein
LIPCIIEKVDAIIENSMTKIIPDRYKNRRFFSLRTNRYIYQISNRGQITAVTIIATSESEIGTSDDRNTNGFDITGKIRTAYHSAMEGLPAIIRGKTRKNAPGINSRMRMPAFFKNLWFFIIFAL